MGALQCVLCRRVRPLRMRWPYAQDIDPLGPRSRARPGLWPYSTSISVRPPGRARPRAQWRRLDGRLVPEAPEASPVLPQRRHKGAAVPRGACTRRSTTRGRALLAPLESVAP